MPGLEASASEFGSSEVVYGAPLAGPPAVSRGSLMEILDAGSSDAGVGGSGRLPVPGACGSVGVAVAGADISEGWCARVAVALGILGFVEVVAAAGSDEV